MEFDKSLQYALIVALAFVVLSHPWVYKQTDMISRKLFKTPLLNGACPNYWGIGVHATITGLLVYYLLKSNVITVQLA